MSKIKSLGLLLIAIPLMFCALCDVYAQDKIIAIVNNEVITQKDLSDFTNFIRMQLAKEFSDSEIEKRVKDMQPELLDKLIEDRLILQEAKKNNITVDESRLKARIAEIKSRYPSDVEFQKDLANQGLVQADIESKIREQLLMYYVIESQIRSKILVKPEEVTTFYNKNLKEFISPEERQLEMITLENEDQAKSFSYNWRTGEKLEDLATRYPLTVSNIKVSQGKELRKDVEEIVFRLNIGEISDPVKIDNKYYVLKLDDVIASKQLSLLESQDKIYSFLFENKMQQKLANWLDELKKGSYIKVVQD